MGSTFATCTQSINKDTNNKFNLISNKYKKINEFHEPNPIVPNYNNLEYTLLATQLFQTNTLFED